MRILVIVCDFPRKITRLYPPFLRSVFGLVPVYWRVMDEFNEIGEKGRRPKDK
jgi:hypothetical protein